MYTKCQDVCTLELPVAVFIEALQARDSALLRAMSKIYVFVHMATLVSGSNMRLSAGPQTLSSAVALKRHRNVIETLQQRRRRHHVSCALLLPGFRARARVASDPRPCMAATAALLPEFLPQ